MAKLETLIRRNPLREFELHRAYARDENFREAFDHYEDARTAHEHWQAIGDSQARALEYAQLVAELEAEILAYLDTVQTVQSPSTMRDSSHRRR